MCVNQTIVYMLHMENKNMKSYAIIIKLVNTINELKPVAWVGLKPTLLMAMNPLPSCSNLD